MIIFINLLRVKFSGNAYQIWQVDRGWIQQLRIENDLSRRGTE
jgi:hypothetical protein